MENENFSEKKIKRFIGNKKIMSLSISLIITCILSGVYGISFVIIDNKYNNLSDDYDNLTGDYENMSEKYNELLNIYQILTGDYNTLFDNYQDLQNSYDAVCSKIKQSILQIQYSIFAEAVRRYYMDIYLDAYSEKTYWRHFAELCRDIILHDSSQFNSFSIVSNAFSNALIFRSNTMYLANYIMYYSFYDWLPNWNGYGLIENELTDIDTIVNWCINEIDYEYDLDITVGQDYFNWDYIKFPVENAFRTMGDCED